MRHDAERTHRFSAEVVRIRIFIAAKSHAGRNRDRNLKGFKNCKLGCPADNLVREIKSFGLIHSDPVAQFLMPFMVWVLAGLQKDGATLESVCLVARTKKLLELYAGNLRPVRFETYEIKRDSAEQRDRTGIRLATMHRVKGLELIM